MRGVTCLACGQPVLMTDWQWSPVSDALTVADMPTTHTTNRPCGCEDGGLRFDFTET